MDKLLGQKAKADYLFYTCLVGKRLYAFRKDRDESLRTVGKAVGMAPGTINKIEEGLSAMRPSRLFRLCNYYGVSISDILRYNKYTMMDGFP